MNTLKEIANNPWLKIFQLLIIAIVGLFLFFVVEAKGELKVGIDKNEENISKIKKDISRIELEQVQNSTILEYIKETLDEIKGDVKDIKKK